MLNVKIYITNLFIMPFWGMRINETFNTSLTSGGLLDIYGNCEGTTFMNTRGTWNNVIVQGKYKIQLSESIALGKH